MSGNFVLFAALAVFLIAVPVYGQNCLRGCTALGLTDGLCQQTCVCTIFGNNDCNECCPRNATGNGPEATCFNECNQMCGLMGCGDAGYANCNTICAKLFLTPGDPACDFLCRCYIDNFSCEQCCASVDIDNQASCLENCRFACDTIGCFRPTSVAISESSSLLPGFVMALTALFLSFLVSF